MLFTTISIFEGIQNHMKKTGPNTFLLLAWWLYNLYFIISHTYWKTNQLLFNHNQDGPNMLQNKIKYTRTPFSSYLQIYHSNVIWSCCRVYINDFEQNLRIQWRLIFAIVIRYYRLQLWVGYLIYFKITTVFF